MSPKLSDQEIVKRLAAGHEMTKYQLRRAFELLNESITLASCLAIDSKFLGMAARTEELKDLLGHKYVDRPVRRDCDDCSPG